MKMDKLCLAIVQAELSHIQSQFEDASPPLDGSHEQPRRFTLASGRSIRIILHPLPSVMFYTAKNPVRLETEPGINWMP
jgi:hypothetical protein